MNTIVALLMKYTDFASLLKKMALAICKEKVASDLVNSIGCAKYVEQWNSENFSNH